MRGRAHVGDDREMRVDRWSGCWWLQGTALILAALTMGMAFAHVLELPEKMSYAPRLWTALNQTLYQYFAVVGGPVEVANVVLLGFLAAGERRRRPRCRGFLLAAGCFAVALAVWFAVVNPANQQVASWPVNHVPVGWGRWRSQWEYGHAVRFALMLAGYCALARAVLDGRPRAWIAGEPMQASDGGVAGHPAGPRP